MRKHREMKPKFIPHLTLAPLWFIDVFFSFQGRIDTAQFVARIFVLFLIFALFAVAAVSYFSQSTVSLLFVTLPLSFPVSMVSLVIRRLHDHNISGKEAWKLNFSLFIPRGAELLEKVFEFNYPMSNKYGERPSGALSMNPERKRHHLGKS